MSQMTPDDVQRIGKALYRDVAYKGAEAWKAWLADGLGTSGSTVKRWTTDSGEPGHVPIPEPIARILAAVEPLARSLGLHKLPRGTSIVGRLAELKTPKTRR